jgi:hypothetical protein
MADSSIIVTDSPTAVVNSTTVMSEQQQSALFEKIPPELRIKIYKYALDDIRIEPSWTCQWKTGFGGKHGCYIEGVELLRVCKKIFNEVIPYTSTMPLVADWSGLWYDPDFFASCSTGFRHRLVKVTLRHPEWWGAFSTEEINQNQYPNLRVIELSQRLGMNVPHYFPHVARLLQHGNGPAEYIDYQFTQDARISHGCPELIGILQTSGIVLQTKVDLRIAVWEKLSGWPYASSWRRVYRSEHCELVSPDIRARL